MQKTFLTWAGNKTKLIPTILLHLPEHNRLIEPFMGSGSFMLNRITKEYIGADINADLISVFQYLQSEGMSFIKYIATFFTEKYGNNVAYNELRTVFNHSQDKREKAALFVYLNKHAFGGICRYNTKTGHFNTPGRQNLTSKKLPLEQLRATVFACEGCSFYDQSFDKTMQLAISGDVVYCDPPYLPEADKDGTFTAYSKLDFNLDDHKHLVELAEELSNRNISTIISNHNSPLTQELYKNAKLIEVDAYRSMGRYNTNIQRTAKELLAIYKGK